MLNLGLIGDIKLLEPFAQKAQVNPEIHITGKSSVGTQPKPGSFRLQAPEFNRIELIERTDILFINKFSLLPFGLLCDMVKKSKHIFATSYPGLQPAEITHLAKLASEAKTVIQVANPFYFLPVMQWFSKIIKKPAYLDVTYYNPEYDEKHILLQLILMLKDISGLVPKKSSAVSFSSSPANSLYRNVQLDFGDGSVLNLNLGKMDEKIRFSIKAFMPNKFAELDLIRNNCLLNHSPVDLSGVDFTDETSSFLSAVLQNKKSVTDFETYANALQSVKIIGEKLERYSSN